MVLDIKKYHGQRIQESPVTKLAKLLSCFTIGSRRFVLLPKSFVFSIKSALKDFWRGLVFNFLDPLTYILKKKEKDGTIKLTIDGANCGL